MFLAILLFSFSLTPIPRLSPADVQALVEKNDAVLVDVRGSVPYELSHIDGAIWMPLGLMKQRGGELPEEKLIVTYCTCKAEETSLEAANELHALGFKRVAVLSGGYPAWSAAGLPVASSRGGRLAPPAAVGCDRNQLTSYTGAVTSYRRTKRATTLVISTDEGTTETITLRGADPSAAYLVHGTPFTEKDWNRIESKKGTLRPGIRVTAWVGSGGKTIVDWQP